VHEAHGDLHFAVTYQSVRQGHCMDREHHPGWWLFNDVRRTGVMGMAVARAGDVCV
jgi:hypothetical protein